MRVVVADSSQFLLERLVLLLASVPTLEIVGYAHDMRRAAELAREPGTEVVILDPRTQGEAGFEVLRTLRKENPRVFLLTLTDSPFPQYHAHCRRAGADFVLDKCKEMSRLLDLVHGRLQAIWSKN